MLRITCYVSQDGVRGTCERLFSCHLQRSIRDTFCADDTRMVTFWVHIGQYLTRLEVGKGKMTELLCGIGLKPG